MNLRLMSIRFRLAALAALLFSAPAFAHWGSSTPWTFAGETNYCKHGSSANSDYRKVRLDTYHAYLYLCAEDGCYYHYFGEDSQVTNDTPSGKSNSGRADIFLAGFDNALPPGSWLPYMVYMNDVPRKSARNLSASYVGRMFANLQTSCQTSDAMLN